jgi:hypothetical protein
MADRGVGVAVLRCGTDTAPSGYLIQALVDDIRIHVVVELLVDVVRDPAPRRGLQ